MTAFGVSTTVPPAAEPVSLDEAKRQCRLDLDGADEDDELARFVADARAEFEGQTGLRLVTQTVVVTLPGFPADAGLLALPVGPVQAVTAVRYRDAYGVLQTLAAGEYDARVRGFRGALVPAVNACWPATRCGDPEAVEVEAVVGFGAAAAVPADIKQAILAAVALSHEHRGDDADGAGKAELPPAAMRVIRRRRLAGYL